MNGGIDQSIGPGIGGFVAFFLLALALWFLMRNMSKRLRHVQFEEEAEEERYAAETGDYRPRHRQIFLPVEDETAAWEAGTASGIDDADEVRGVDARAEGEQRPGGAVDDLSSGRRG